MPNKKKLYDALVKEGYNNFENEDAFNAYVESPENRKTLYNALVDEGFDNFEDESAFHSFLGYGESDEPRTTSGGVGTQEEADAIFEANAERYKQGLPIQRVTTQSVLDAQNKVSDSEIQRLKGIMGKAQQQIDDASFFDRFFDEETRTAVATRNKAEEALEMYDEANREKETWFDRNVVGALKGFSDKVGDLSTWDFGASGVASAVALKDAVAKMEAGEKLSSAEQNLLDAYGLASAVQAAYQDKVGMAYNVGGSLPESMAFGASLALNPLGGAGKKIGEAAAKAAVKKYGTALESKLAKGAARVGGDVLEMGVATAVPGAGRVAEDYYNRLNGQATFDIDDNGIVRYGGQVQQEEADNAIWKAMGSQFIENYSEAMGNYFAPMGQMLSNLTSKGLKAAHLGKFAEVLSDVSSSQFSKGLQRFKQATKFDGLVGEYLEEVAGNVMNAATVGDMNFNSPDDPRSVFNPETNIETFLSCALLSGTMYAVEAPVSIYNKNVAKKNLNKADTEAKSLWGDRWDDMRSQMDEADPQLLAQLLTGVQNATDLSDEQKQAAKDYGMRLMQYQGYNARRMQNVAESTSEANAINNAYDEGSDLQTPADKHQAKLAVDRAEAALGEDAAFVQTVMNGAETPVATINAMAEQGYSEEQIEKAKDYYSAMNRMNGMTDALLDEVDSQIESANVEVDMNTNKELNQVIKVVLRDGRQGYVVNGTVTANEEGVVDVNHSDSEIMVRFENGDTDMMNPNKDLQSVAWIDSPAKLKENNNTVLRQSLIDNGIQEIDWNPATPNPKVGDSFEMDGIAVTIVGHDGHGGMFVLPSEEWQAAQGSEQKQQAAIAKAQQMGVVQAGMFKQWASDQLDAQEEAQAMAQQEAETVTNSNELQPVAEGVAETQPTEEVAAQLEAEPVEAVNEAAPVEEAKLEKPAIPTKEDGSVDFVAYGKEGSFKILGEKYGEKMPKKVEVTAKALANDLKKAENAIYKAQNDLDNAPIGRDDKQQAKLDKAKQDYEAVKREADFWAEMDADIKAAQAQREAILNPVAEVDSSAEPQSVDEFVAQQLASGNIILDKEDYKKETGYGDAEANAMNGGSIKLFGKNGMTIQEAGERLMEMDRENGTNFFDQSDPNAGRDALIDLLGSVKTRKELNSYIKDKREYQAERETEALRSEVEDFIRDNFHMTPEDYATLLEVEMQNNPYEGVDLKAIDAIFAEKEFGSETLNEQENESEGNVDGNSGESELLHEEQAGEPSGNNPSQTDEQAEGIGSGTPAESETSQASQPSEVRRPQIADVFAAAEKIDAEEKRRRPLRNRANEWAKALGVKVHFIERVEDVKSANVREALKNGNKVAGWYSQVTGEVFFLMPNLDNVDEIDNTYVHEVVAHKGMFDMLGKERYDALCDKVWEMMPKSEQKRFINYPGVNGNTRIAADEYIAHLSESLKLSPEQQGIWDKIVQFFRELFDQKLNGILSKSNITNDDISNLIKASYANLKSGAEGGVGEGERFRFSKTPEEFDAIQKEAVEKKGIVMPGLNEAVVDVLSIEKHDFNGNLKQARKEAKQWAIENYQGKEFSLPGEGGSYTIGKKAINKYVDKTSVGKSDNAMIHLSALKELPNIISSSVTGEIHADYKKDENEKRNTENGIKDKGLLVHRMYGAIKLDDKIYRVKTTMNEYRDPLALNNPHSYEVTEIELIESSSTPSSKDDSKLVNVSNNSITGAKLLNGVEKSYDKGKKLLDESEKTRFRVTPEHKQHQMDIINETNPSQDDVHTWIRSVEDIKSFEEALDDSDYADYKGEDFDPSYTWNMVEDALETGKVTVYSSYPIKNGVFVTPSYMEAQSYGGTTPYMAKVNLDDVAWIDPTQGQLATENKVTSRKSPSGVRFRVSNRNQEIFVSNAQKAVESIKQEKATPQQWLAMIEKNGGLKAGEDKWLGLSDWLKDSDAKTITKSEILDFIGENKIQIEEVHYGEGGGINSLRKQYPNFDEAFYVVEDYFGPSVQIIDSRKAVEIIYDIQSKDNPYVGRYELDEDGLFVDSDDEYAITEYLEYLIKNGEEIPINSTRLEYTTKGLENKAEIALTVPTIEPWNKNDDIHFGDAGEGRAVAWIRFGETFIMEDDNYIREVTEVKEPYRDVNGLDIYKTDSGSNNDFIAHGKGRNGEMIYVAYVNGEQIPVAHKTLDDAKAEMNKFFKEHPIKNRKRLNVLVIDEIQSKRHQDGREKGYKPNPDIYLKENGIDVVESGEFYEFYKNGELDKRFAKSVLNNNINKAKDLYVGGQLKTNIPSAPFEKNWSELAFKRMLRYAAENGFDKVAWTTGMQQAERYNLGNVIDSVSISKSKKEDGKYHITSWDKETMPIGIASGNKTPEELKELFGKEIAQSLIEGVDNLEEGSDTFTLEGADLEVGGEGMKVFYDKMLPSFVNKYVKKWGTKVQDIELPNVEEAGRIMHSVDVTDAMKESVMEGQTMFRIVDNEKQKQIDKEYVDAVHEGDFGKAVGLFREYVLSKAEEYGVVPIDYAVGYRGHSHSSIAKKVKEENPDAISEAAYQMSKRVPKGSILVPMPSRSGKATYTIKLAEAIAKATDSEVKDVLKGEERMSVYEAKKKGLKIDSRDLGLYVTEKLQKDKNVIIVDNVIDRGITALAAVEAVDGGSVLAYAFTKGSKDRVVPLKLSDPITYDDNLRIIPLSERFNANTDDLRFRVLRDPAVDYISQAEDVVEVPRDEVIYTMNNIANQLYKTSGRFMRQLYKYGTLGRVLKGEYAEIDQIKAKQEYDHAKPILEEYLNELVWMKYQATEAAQEVINDVISDVEYAMQYYKDLSLGKDVWRTNVSPRFRISGYGKHVKEEVDRVTSKYKGKEVMFFDAEMTDEEVAAIAPGYTAADLKPYFNEGTLGGYSSRLGKISIFADNNPVYDVEDTIFHENLHVFFADNKDIVEAFADKALSRFPKNVKSLQEKGYSDKEIPEELLVRLTAKAMSYGIFDDVRYNLPEGEFEKLKEFLKHFGYDYREEVKSRSLEEGRRGTPTLLGGEEIFEARRVRQDSGRQKEERRARKEELGKLFDQVADMGLDGVLGNRYYGKLLMDIYQEMPLDVRRYVSASAINQYGGNFVPAMSDYLNVKATAEIWGKVVGFVRDVLRKVGFDIELNQADVKYMLWRSQKPMKKYSALDVAEDIDARRKFGVDEGERFRTVSATPFDPSDKRNEIVKKYDAFLKKGKFNFIEAFQDRMYSVKVFMDMIVGATGKKVRDFENAYEAENQLGSINKPAEEKYLKNFYKPLVEAVKALSDKYGRDAIERYIYCKSGLERNEVLRQRDADEAFNAAKEELDDKLAKGQLTQPQYDALLQQAEDQRQQTLSEDVDYSGIRGMLFNLKAQAINKEYEEGRIDKSTRDARLANLEANRKNVVQNWKQFAENEVTAIESRASSAELKDLWKKINAATNETLRMDYESGMIDKATYDAEKNMMKYYVPLRNWADTTAEEMYEYRSELVRPVSSNQKRAKGRESQADNPIATIALMAQNAIVRGNRNKVKQKFYAFVANRETGLASVRDVWYVKDPTTDTWEAKYADTTNANDAAEFAQILDDFENDMQVLESQGLAYKGKLPLGMKFRASRQQKQAHVVPVMINGKEYAVYVNGNPRPAQAMNGETNSEAANASAWYDKIKRFYGAGLTSWNPDFIIPNMIRDGIHASTMTFLDAGPIAAARFALNGPRAFGQVFAMISGFGKGLVNPQNQTYFEEFIANGGETGYTAIHTLEDYKKEYDKMMNELKGLKGNFLKNGLQGAAKCLEAANRIFEDVNRFNAYVSARESGESIMRSISAAKNITVNFNRKGALSANNTAFGTIANAMSKWILFFNPAVQGIAQLVTKTKVNPKRAAAMASTILASGFFMPMLNEMLVAAGGDDEEDDYWNQSDFKRRNNWLLFTGDGYVSVPLPPVLRELYGIGDIIYGSITGHITPQRAVMDMARQVQSAVGFVNLIPEVSQEPDMVTWAKGFAPDIAAPVLDVISNTNFMGRPIAKWTDFNEYEPEYARVYKGVSPQWVELSKLLNKVGGDEGRRSDVWGNFINPAMMEHLFTNYGGGIGKTINNLAGMALDGIEGNTENLDPYRKSPIVPRFYIPNDEKTVVPAINRKYYDYDYMYNVAKKALKTYQDGVRSKEHPEWKKYIDEMQKNGELEFIQFFEHESKRLTKMQNLIKGNPTNKKELEEKMIDLKADIATKCYEMLK